jgi:hypothetical protein
MEDDFKPFPKISRLRRNCIITEKIDGTNAQVVVGEDGNVRAGSRSRWITPEDDNFGFARWCAENADGLRELGAGQHFGEWWGDGIQRRYGIVGKKFSLFNTGRWGESRPACCDVVPVLYSGPFATDTVEMVLERLRVNGSAASSGFMRPEGVIVFMTASYHLYKVTLEKDEEPKGKAAPEKTTRQLNKARDMERAQS